jgi:type VI secretion system FHA domain protein
MIPADYDPLKDDVDDFSSWEPDAPLTPGPATPPPQPVEVSPPAAEPVVFVEPPPAPARPTPVPTPVAEPAVQPPEETPPASRDRHAGQPDLTGLLAGAGLEGIQATPELVRSFGAILRVVVSGVMDVLRSRQQIKDEFRMRMTQFRPADNNPLKFSANVDDALHNLLVKRNAAYLEPVEAFEDAFEDLRNHQLAMLAGMRVAFESMLAEFDPERLQQQFDRNLKTSWALGVTAKLRYWDLYRDRHQDIIKDPEVAFRKLFGEEFARAYEEQLQRLKAESQVRPPARKTPRPQDG